MFFFPLLLFFRVNFAQLVRRRLLILVIAFVLVLAGIISLYLSYAVAHGWWVGTLQAFGVGFVVGGLVDVLTISTLDQITRTAEDRRKAADARRVLTEAREERVTGATHGGAES
jgi:hypothetical protein